MKRVGRDASVPESVVIAAPVLAAENARSRRTVRKVKVAHPPVTVARVDPQVWATALSLAHGVVARIQRVSATEVIVHNQPRSG